MGNILTGLPFEFPESVKRFKNPQSKYAHVQGVKTSLSYFTCIANYCVVTTSQNITFIYFFQIIVVQQVKMVKIKVTYDLFQVEYYQIGG